jgi:hypothetical protein
LGREAQEVIPVTKNILNSLAFLHSTLVNTYALNRLPTLPSDVYC